MKINMSEDSFKIYFDNKHKGAFLIGVFQGIAVWIYYNIYEIEKRNLEDVKNKIRLFYNEDEYIESREKGVGTVPRFYKLTRLGKKYFGHKN